MLRLPLSVRHAVDPLAGPVIVEISLERLGLGDEPLGEAVSAKPGEVHELNVLNILSPIEVGEEPPKRGGLQLGACSVIHGLLSLGASRVVIHRDDIPWSTVHLSMASGQRA